MSVRGGERTPLLTDGARPERIAELDTPVATVDLDAVERNIRGMQEYCDRHALRLRPHVKTHKLPELAHMQVEAGAVGITCQKLGEAEVMADAGIADILISFPLIGRTKVERLVCLARRVSVSTVVDSEEGARGLSEGAARADITIPVLVECDTGYRRTGVQSPQSAARLAARVASLPGLRFAGLLTYPTLSGTGAWIARARGLIEAAGLDPGTVSTGGTARARRTHELPHVDELRVGTYVYGDCACIADGSVRPADCALRVRSTVVSRPTRERAILDAGSKALSSDPVARQPDGSFGLVVELPEARLYALSEEHGHLDVSGCPRRPVVGDVVTLIPNHACGTANMHDHVAVHRRGVLEGIWRVAARGALR